VALALTSLVGLGLASAQEQTQGEPPANGKVQTAGEPKLEEVVVTGSRIARRDYTSQSPIVTVGSQVLEERSAVGVETGLNQLPQFRPSGSQNILSPAQTPFPQATAAPGAATLDLRGLGINRTLVLFDGRRAQPVNALLAVDINTLPVAAISSVETITGGAAAVYGADAIAGVVNFKLKRDFQGLELDGQYGISQAGDDKEAQLSALMGTNFAQGRGNVMMALTFSDRGGIRSIDRDWVRQGWNDPGTNGGTPGSSNLSSFVPGTTNLPTSAFPIAGPNYYIDQTGHVFDPNHPLDPAHPYTGPLGGTSGFKLNPDGSLGYNDEQRAELQIPLRRWSVFSSGHFNFNDHVSAFAQALFTETYTQADGTSSGLFSVWQVTIPYNHLYDDPNSPLFGNGPAGTSYHPVPGQLASILNSRPNPDAAWTYNGGLDYIGGFTTHTTSDVYQFTTGLNGDIPGTDSTWEIYGSRGNSNVLAQQPDGFPNLQRVQNLFNANQYGQGYSVSYPIAVTGNCTSGLPIFNRDGSVNNTPYISKDCADYILLRMNTVTQLAQTVAEGDLQGGLFDMPFGAGKLRYAFGVDYRSEDFNFNPDSGYNANQDYPEVVQNIALPVAVQGNTKTTEAYGELSIPLVKGLPLLESLEVDPGYRLSHYNTAGNVKTWKMTLDWKLTSWVGFRGGYQLANRAPNVAELFTPIGGSQLTGINGQPLTPDPCAVYPGTTPTWGNDAGNPNRYNVQTLCQYLITRDGGPAAVMVPGASANNYQYNVFGYSPTPFPFSIAVTQGNPNLQSEVGRTWTAGTVIHSPLQHPLLERLSLSVDWYQIEISKAIGIPYFNTVYQECLDAQYNPTVGAAPGTYTGAQMAAANPYCALIQREYAPQAGDLYGAPRKYKAQYINQGGITTRGIDAQLDWSARFADMGMKAIPGSFAVNVIASYLKNYSVSPFPGAAFIDYTGTTVNSSFRYKLFSTFAYNVGPGSLGFRWQHLPSVGAPPGSSPGQLGADAHDQVDMFASWSIARCEIRGGIDNLLNARPEWVGYTPANHNVGATLADYDPIGRRFYVGVKARF
jgi:outer membrane receptor protein involved in Fe transport